MEAREVLDEVMRETRTSQSDLARISGVRQPSISQFLSGRIQMSDEMVDRLLSCMGYRLEVVRRPVRVQMDRSHRRSWRLHRQLATHLSAEALDEWRPAIRQNVARLDGLLRGEPHRSNLRRWERMVTDADLAGLRHAMTGSDLDAVQMREVSPLAGLLAEEERMRVLEELRA